MRKLILIGGLIAATAIPLAAQAETRCDRTRNNHEATGVVGGAVGGALIGNALAGKGSRGEGTVLGAIGGAIVGSQIAKGASSPCPAGYYAYDTETRRYVDPVPVAVAPPPGGDYRGEFWRTAPQGIGERINFMEQRIQAGRDDGTLTRREYMTAQDDLKDIRFQQENLRRRDRGLSPADRDYLQSRLDTLGQRIRWMRNNDNSRRRY